MPERYVRVSEKSKGKMHHSQDQRFKKRGVFKRNWQKSINRQLIYS